MELLVITLSDSAQKAQLLNFEQKRFSFLPLAVAHGQHQGEGQPRHFQK